MEKLRALAEELRITAQVHFCGFMEHARLGALYMAADVFVLPSVVEVQPLVAIEAMRFGRPVIVTRQIAAARELVADGESGYIVAPDDPEGLADRLQTLAGDPSLRKSMGANGIERSRVFAPEHAVRELEEIYRLLLR